ncbi:MutS protein-like protein [Smittium mucronatum]|uniref:MutS protein-like protein n=1 Tax=Smittium mucronatum TaxID=133383 RepID=A0A1R0GNR1_9FUNG|nr:MutS protein-like protein [Smittium mucronatum]
MLGAAHYSFSGRELKILEDTKENSSFDLCSSIVRQVIPDVIITNNKNQELVEILKKQIPIIMVTPNVLIKQISDFQLSTSSTRLISACSSIAKNEIQKQETDHINNFVNENNLVSQWVFSILGNNNDLSIGCAGALLLYVQNKEAYTKNIDINLGLIRKLNKFNVNPIMHISYETMQALDIFTNEKHPNMHVRSKQKKEGLSLFALYKQFKNPAKPKGLLDTTKTHSGRHLLQIWMLRPFQSIKEIESRQENVGLMTENGPRAIQVLGNINNNDYERNRRESGGQTEYRSYKLNHVYDGLGSFLTEVAQDLSEGLPQELSQKMTVVYFPQLGYLVSFEIDKVKSNTNFISSLSDWKMMFNTEERAYYKNSRMTELDEYLGDIHAHIVDREIEIIQQLKQEVRSYSEYILEVNSHLSELDCLLALSKAARENNWTKPIEYWLETLFQMIPF